MVQKKSASSDLFFLDQDKSARPIHPVARGHLPQVVKKLSAAHREWVKATGFSAKPHSQCLLPDGKGGIATVLVGYDPAQGPFAFGDLAGALPTGSYFLAPGIGAALAHDLALGWALGAYVFDRYRKVERPAARLVWPKGVDRAEVRRLAAGTQMVRDLINTPAEDLGPEELEAAARQVAKAHGAKFKSIVGAKLLPANYPLIHAVGRAATREPRLIDMTWGSKGPQVTLVGKGVCFDSGGLDLKSADGMKLMKKDMGGAAHVLALAEMIMSAKLPVRLRLMIPAVENMVSGNAIRPLDVIKSRGGLTVEIGNTDAEGRLILCDALAEAVRQKPALLLDFATLTGAARVALGTDLPALFCNHEATAAAFLAAGLKSHDPLWRLPLHRPYRRLLDSKVADLNSISEGGYGGAVTAALFLEAFVPDTVPWAHVDLMAWNLTGRPGRPAGGEALGLRAAYRLIEQVAAKGGPLG